MKIIRLFNVYSGRHLKANVFRHPVPAKDMNFNSNIYILIISVKYAIQSYTQTSLLPF